MWPGHGINIVSTFSNFAAAGLFEKLQFAFAFVIIFSTVNLIMNRNENTH